RGAEHDAWVSVLVFGFLLRIVFFMMMYILKQSNNGDILSVHKETFGKIFGGLLNMIVACYFALASLFAFHTYIDILQIWVFNGIASWEYSLLLIVVIYYIIAGGFR